MRVAAHWARLRGRSVIIVAISFIVAIVLSACINTRSPVGPAGFSAASPKPSAAITRVRSVFSPLPTSTNTNDPPKPITTPTAATYRNIALASDAAGSIATHLGTPFAANAVKSPTVPEPNLASVSRYGVYEIKLSYPTSMLKNPWQDVAVTARFESPGGRTYDVDGFYYDANTYLVRFVPMEIGTYRYVAAIHGPTSFTPLQGRFVSIASAGKGFVHPLSSDHRRLGFDDGTPFNAIGLNDCWTKDPSSGTTLASTTWVDDVQQVGVDDYFATYGRAGFNLFRWGIGNCSFSIATNVSPKGNTYLVTEAKLGDQLLQAASRANFHVMLTIFNQPPFPNASAASPEMDAVLEYVRYVMARYGAYVDIWEITNESLPDGLSEHWLRSVARYVHANDPYHRIVTNSFPRPGDWVYLDASAPHWYSGASDSDADKALVDVINKYSGHDAPILFGETGFRNINWDATSALRMRVMNWTAFFNRATLVYWNSSFKKGYYGNGASNIYLGRQERGYVRVMQDITAQVDSSFEPVAVKTSISSVRAYALRSPHGYLAYVYHFADHTSSVVAELTVDVPVAGTITWIDPASGETVASSPVSKGQQVFTTPSFRDDLLVEITPKKFS